MKVSDLLLSTLDKVWHEMPQTSPVDNIKPTLILKSGCVVVDERVFFTVTKPATVHYWTRQRLTDKGTKTNEVTKYIDERKEYKLKGSTLTTLYSGASHE